MTALPQPQTDTTPPEPSYPADLHKQYITRIVTAPVYDVAVETPLQLAPALSTRLRNTVLLKREDLQPVYSFKIRGAYTKVARLSAEDKARGVIAASAGNHAQGLAHAAQKLGIKATIVMPITTPEVKIRGVTTRGADVILYGDAFPEALTHAQALAHTQGYTFVPPYDDPDVIAGQGTVAVEILRQHPGPIDAIFVPVGGGSLIAGIAAYVKYMRPDIRIIGVEPDDANCLQLALQANERIILPSVGLFADGVAVAQVGEYNFELCRYLVDEVITVTSDEICAAIKDVYDDTRSITEPAGALAVAGLKKYVGREELTGRVFLAINSGANVNFNRLRHVAERAELGENHEAILSIALPERPGSLKSFFYALGKRQVTEFNYRYQADKQAHVFLGVQTHPQLDPRDQLLEDLRRSGSDLVDLSDNELAKLHIRHTVGGRVAALSNERIFRVEFPERPGALKDFVDALPEVWNITLFHYRNHGSDSGRALIGLQLPENESVRLYDMLENASYRWVEETDNPAYLMFLG
ncbi:threonine ammonia-lyase, biosynthetic [Pseudomonas luteola]|uniref:threonine ammonia-lyase, biosynthetic n=1 Tax=Pseudomonas luteola TaxID=47886 RepID=UPI000F76E8ED|nr:threonine ammonia-lyase, biosynthetic [Pseudomonas luteola]MCG7374107.1 threonine ammonia-lyase, biosynthetic [Pseudomonas luteola]RRW39549.1 threonine ammonia-lyase, biosynthetic [Pseudomonas luteola]